MGVRIENEYILNDDFCILIVYSKSYGRAECYIDLEDVEKVKCEHWNISRSWNRKSNIEPSYYIICKTISMQRYIMDCPKGMVVDHINHNTYDNRRRNLRICKYSENCRNKKVDDRNKSGYVGVNWNKTVGKWMAVICVQYKRMTLGYFDNIEDAVARRREAEKELFGEYAYDVKT